MSARRKRSKRRSGASSTSKLPDAPVLLDEALGAHIVANALEQVGVHVLVHRDHFQPGTPDDQWLTEAGRNGWIVFSKDRGLKRRTNELSAIRDAHVKAFVLTAADLTGAEMAEAFVRALPKIAKIANATPSSVVATVNRSGQVKILP